MDEPVGQKYIFAVAQLPFETASAHSGVYNQFCALLPLFDANGVVANLQDFPDNGDVWWMVQPGVRGFAEPSRLVTGIIEESKKKGEQGIAQYQVIADSVEPVRGRDYVEIIDVPATVITTPRDLVSSSFRLPMDHVPLDTSYVRWNRLLLGRFRTKSDASEEPGQWNVGFAPEASDNTVLRISADILEIIDRSNQLKTSVRVSMERRPLHESHQLIECHYHLVDAEALDRAFPREIERISIRTNKQVVQQLAKRLLTRSKRQTLMGMLEELDDLAVQSDSLEQEEHETLEALKSGLANELTAIGRVAEAIVDTGVIEDQIEIAIRSRVEQHIADNAAKLQSEVNKRIADTRREIESLTRDKEQIESELKNYRARRHKDLEQELQSKRQDFDQSLAREQESIQKQLTELRRQENVLSNNLEEIARTLGEKRDEVVNQFLTIAPLLTQFGLLPGTQVQEAQQVRSPSEMQSNRTQPEAQNLELESFVMPVFAAESTVQEITEAAFFERFTKHVEACGFRYREIDLLTFHVSVKCGDLTILGGLPGTGKSSLSRLYAEAIHGSSSEDEIDRFLHVAVSPSWLDMRDLIGHVNALNRTFQPADSTLYQHLLYAQEECSELGDSSELYFVCLDEMNLSHVEHYFSGLLQVLEYPEGQRRLRCFAENVVDPRSPFSRYSAIAIPHSVRFIGTVNFDETTKQLSQRLLDRANLIRLPSNQLPLELEDSSSADVSGPAVRVRDYRSWIHSTAAFGDELASLIDALRDDLRVLNCPMNPRRFSAMRKFIASWPNGIAPVEQAIDLQFAQRVLPQVRGLFQPGAREALNLIRRKLQQHQLSFPESLRILDDVHNSEHGDILFDPEASV